MSSDQWSVCGQRACYCCSSIRCVQRSHVTLDNRSINIHETFNEDHYRNFVEKRILILKVGPNNSGLG
ncbi:hypothetical protein RRG08_017519 [Elysia crispata]|uniref:Uncharacterized protein n=1 Tax=Elysia crispata TaxID=231223 RepID=A0AAE1CQT9_9GAST|nr:hypothetical protein RRG08_017519 [Elysia crispata]